LLMLPIVLYRIPSSPKRFGYVVKKSWLLQSVANIAGLNFTIRHYIMYNFKIVTSTYWLAKSGSMCHETTLYVM